MHYGRATGPLRSQRRNDRGCLHRDLLFAVFHVFRFACCHLISHFENLYFRLPYAAGHTIPAARAIRNNPATTTTAPMARATRSPAGARRSALMAAATTTIARKSMTPMRSE